MCFVGLFTYQQSPYEPSPLWKFSGKALQMQQSDQNTRRNNLRFLHRTATCIINSHMLIQDPKYKFLGYLLVTDEINTAT